MDPATITLAIRALDMAWLIGTYMMRRAESDAELEALTHATDEIRRIRGAVESGVMDAEDADARLTRIADDVLAPLRVAMGRL